MIKRFKDKEITSLLKQFPIVAIIGPRQCGKTTLAQFNVLKNKTTGLYFDLESPKDNTLFQDSEYFLENLMPQVMCIVIDEVQRKPELFSILRSLVDKNKKKGKFVLLGSASPEMVKGVSESLAGRIAYCEISPFNLIEVCKNDQDLEKLWFRGGFPDAFLSKTDKSWFVWMDNFFRTFVERDLNTLFGVNFSSILMYQLWRMLAHHHGQIWNAQSFAKGLDISPTTVNKYLDYLEGSFMIRRLPAFYTNGKKRLIKSPKVYVRDSGLLHYLNDVSAKKDLLFQANLGNSWEGFAIEQVLQHLPNHIKAYYYRTQDGSEMDLVLVKGLKPILTVELKTTNNPKLSKGYYESIEDLKCTENYVVTPQQDFTYQINDSSKVMGLKQFVQEVVQKLD